MNRVMVEVRDRYNTAILIRLDPAEEGESVANLIQRAIDELSAAQRIAWFKPEIRRTGEAA